MILFPYIFSFNNSWKEDPFWDRIRRQNRREEKYKYVSKPFYEIQKEAPRLLKVRKQK